MPSNGTVPIDGIDMAQTQCAKVCPCGEYCDVATTRCLPCSHVCKDVHADRHDELCQRKCSGKITKTHALVGFHPGILFVYTNTVAIIIKYW